MREREELIPVARHEPTDIGERFVWWAAASMLGLLAACALVTWLLYPRATLDRTLELPLPVYPAPRLQANPAADLRAFRARELERLNGTGWIDKTHGIVHIPIEDAMRSVAKQGIADWPKPSGGAR